jgi:hypothetical protein
MLFAKFGALDECQRPGWSRELFERDAVPLKKIQVLVGCACVNEIRGYCVVMLAVVTLICVSVALCTG